MFLVCSLVLYSLFSNDVDGALLFHFCSMAGQVNYEVDYRELNKIGDNGFNSPMVQAEVVPGGGKY